ncbi:MAG: hypothetical protein ACYTFY_23065 [Planctomycetota bacterium]|jgi:hypothetical protein
MSASESRRINISRSDFVSLTSSSFIIISMILIVIHQLKIDTDYHFILRGNILRDLIAGLQLGRQSLISSLNLMPMTTLSALPFVPFLNPENYGYAILYADTMLLCFCALPLANMLSGRYAALPRFFSVLVLSFTALLLSFTGCSNFIAPFAFLLLALYFTSHSNAVLKALSGVFWGALLFSNIAGIAAAGLFLTYRTFKRIFLKPDEESKAVGWIQMFILIYTAGIYLFLNWMIMGDPFYAAAKTNITIKSPKHIKAAADIKKLLGEKYSGYAPIVSGNWGYLIEPVLRKHRGHHFVDFSPARIPDWEKRSLLLIVPATKNPFAFLSDINTTEGNGPDFPNTLLLAKDRNWYFYLVEKN